jgi:hypothetical protein
MLFEMFKGEGEHTSSPTKCTVVQATTCTEENWQLGWLYICQWQTWTCHRWCTITLPKVKTQASFMEMLGNWNGLIKCYKQNGFTTTLVENMIPHSSDHLNYSCCSDVTSNGHYPLVGHRRVLKLDFILWLSWSLWITWLSIGAINEWSCKWGYVGQCKC